MSNHDHIILKHVFDISYSQKEKAYELQNKVSRLFYAEAVSIMENIFERVVPSDTLVRLDSVQLDIGTLPYERLENEFGVSFREALLKELQLRISLVSNTGATDGEQSSGFKASYAELLEHFLLTGFLPWWARGELLSNPVAVVELLIREKPVLLKHLVLRIAQQQHVRRRIVYQFPDTVMSGIIKILEPAQAEFIFSYQADIIKIQHEKQVIKTELSEFEKAVREFVLTFLVSERGSYFNRKEFVRSTLRQMAHHFNVHYEALLELFAVALEKTPPFIRLNNSLSGIIYDLYKEQAYQLPLSKKRGADEKKELRAAVLTNKQKLDIVRYFLVFGSLPVRAVQLDALGLSKLFLELMNTIPGASKQMILTLGEKSEVRLRMVDTFDDQVMHSVLELVEPGHELFILRYKKNMEELHYKKSTIKTDSSSFRRSIWDFILAFLLAKRENEFNTRMFLQTNIRQMAHRYHLEYGELLSFLVQGIGQEVLSSEDGSFFQLLRGILNNHNEEQQLINKAAVEPGLLQTSIAVDPENTSKEEGPVMAVRDVLKYLLMYGGLPWWGKSYAAYSFEQLWRQLTARSPADIIVLIKYAGVNPVMQRRLVSQLTVATLLESFCLLSCGADAKLMYESIVAVVENNPLLKLKYSFVLRSEMLMSLWEVMATTNFTSWDDALFVERTVFRLSQWTGIYPENIFRSLHKAVVQKFEGSLSTKLTGIFQEASETLRKKSVDIYTAGEGEIPDIEVLISEYLSPGIRAAKEDIIKECFYILEFYLTFNRLPDQFNGTSGSFLHCFLKQLIQLALREKPALFKEIMDKGMHSAPARLQLHDLFANNKIVPENSTRLFLKEYREADILRYLQQLPQNELASSGTHFRSIINDALQQHGDEKVHGFVRSFLLSDTISGYVARNYNEDAVFTLIRDMNSGWGKEAVPFSKEVQQLFQSAISESLERENFNLLFREFNLIFLVGRNSLPDARAFLSSFLQFLSKRHGGKLFVAVLRVLKNVNHASYPELSPFITDLRTQVRFLTAWQTRYEEAQALIKTSEKHALARIHDRPDKAGELRLIERDLQKVKLRLEVQENETKKVLPRDDESIYIRNAGLVILHPLFNTFFNRLGLIEKGQFINQEAQFRAVHLLQFLVYGTEWHAEHELVLNKILCNVPLEIPVPLEIIITENEKGVAFELLKVVLQQWEKLKNSSIDGLRVSFLQREGALTQTEDEWRLKVEQRGYDVLLANLPWSFGMIKTSWMKKILYVEWT